MKLAILEFCWNREYVALKYNKNKPGNIESRIESVGSLNSDTLHLIFSVEKVSMNISSSSYALIARGIE